MNENVYMHAINKYSMDDQIVTFFEIVKDGAILSLRNRGESSSDSFSGLDYISLCDYEKKNLVPKTDKYYNAYNVFVRYGITFAFPKDAIEIIKPKIYIVQNDYLFNKKMMKYMGNFEERYSDFLDEVQTKDRISLDSLEYITFPTRMYFNKEMTFSRSLKCKMLKNRIEEIKSILNYFNYDVDIYDIDSKIKLDEEGIIRLIYKK